MKSNIYISAKNQKAYEHFYNMEGVQMTFEVKTTHRSCTCGSYFCDHYSSEYSRPVYYITGGIFSEMSGREFSRYMRENGLAYDLQS